MLAQSQPVQKRRPLGGAPSAMRPPWRGHGPSLALHPEELGHGGSQLLCARCREASQRRNYDGEMTSIPRVRAKQITSGQVCLCKCSLEFKSVPLLAEECQALLRWQPWACLGTPAQSQGTDTVAFSVITALGNLTSCQRWKL